MTPEEYAECDATDLAAIVKAGQVTPAELSATALKIIDTLNPKLNAVIETFTDSTEQILAAHREAPFYGVPFLIKDILLHVRGKRCDMGSRLVHGTFEATQDTDLMQRFRRSGVITLGRTNTPEFGYNASTEPLLYGVTRNPWEPGHSPGGSSGGSAAAVAAGMVPFAHANDGGGSIRIPAAACGLVGLKPTRGRTPVGPELGNPLHGLGIEHIVSRSVRDCAAMLDAIEGPGSGDQWQIPRPERSYAKEIAAAPRRLRIAYSAEPDGNGRKPTQETVNALLSVAKRCETMGHRVEEAKPQYDHEAFDSANICLWTSFLAAVVTATAGQSGRQPSTDTLETSVLASYEHGKSLGALDLEAALSTMNTVNRTVAPFFARYDVLLTPVLPGPALKLGVLNANADNMNARKWYEHLFEHCPYTALYNMTGQPAMSLPLAQSRDGLPIGIQLIARFGEERDLFMLAAQLAEEFPWRARRPVIHAAHP